MDALKKRQLPVKGAVTESFSKRKNEIRFFENSSSFWVLTNFESWETYALTCHRREHLLIADHREWRNALLNLAPKEETNKKAISHHDFSVRNLSRSWKVKSSQDLQTVDFNSKADFANTGSWKRRLLSVKLNAIRKSVFLKLPRAASLALAALSISRELIAIKERAGFANVNCKRRVYDGRDNEHQR